MSITIPIVRSGYDLGLKVLIEIDGKAEDLTNATIKACLKNKDKSATLIASTTQSISAPGADWPNGVVVIQFTAAQTAGLTTPQNGWIEIHASVASVALPVNDVYVSIEKGYLT